MRCSTLALMRGRPIAFPLFVPLALARAKPALTRATIMLRSNSAKTPIMPKKRLSPWDFRIP